MAACENVRIALAVGCGTQTANTSLDEACDIS